MTPVASGIANTDKDRFMLFFSTCNRFFSPGAPVDQIVGMLKQQQTRQTASSNPLPLLLER
jgi:hypothetical protein